MNRGFLLLLLGGVLSPLTALASERACTIEGTFSLMGQEIYSKDCIELHAEGKTDDLKRMCDGLAQTSAALGGQAGTVTYSEKCPRPAQGACVGLAQQPATAYYYARSDEDIIHLPASCKMIGGSWQEAN
jgi:hypothetical protein